MKKAAFLLIILLSLDCHSGFAFAKDVEKNQSQIFELDFACFRADTNLSYLEIYSQIPFINMNFIQDRKGDFVSPQLIQTRVFQNGKIVRQSIISDSVRARTFAETNSSFDALSCLQSYVVQPGNYDCEVEYSDVLSGASTVRKMQIEVPDYSINALSISNVQLAMRIVNDDLNSPFTKSGLRIDPNPSRIYSYLIDQIPVYYEIYNIPKASSENDREIDIVFSILDDQKRIVKQLSHKSHFGADDCVQSALVPVQDLQVGEYELRIEIVHPKTGTTSSVSQEFMIGEQELTKNTTAYRDLLDQLEYIASENEFQQIQYLFKKQNRRAVLAFWAYKDPTPETADNELMEEFYRRVYFANLNFATDERKGWQTEAGRIFIKFGPPDSIRKSKMMNSQEPCEVWTYKKLKRQYILLANNEVIKIRT